MKLIITSSLLLVASSAFSTTHHDPLSSSWLLSSRDNFSQLYMKTSTNMVEGRSQSSMVQEASTLDISERTASDSNMLFQFTEGYQKLQKDYYLPVAFLQAAVLASAADMATQTMETSSIDLTHTAAMAIVASIMSGAANALWLQQLEQAFPGKGTKAIFCKTMIHATILASIINSAYLAFVPFFTSALHGDVLSLSHMGWSLDEFITLTKLEILMFIPYNTLAFKFVPPSVRPLTHAAISATFNVAVSAVTLGYFNKWCESAMNAFSL